MVNQLPVDDQAERAVLGACLLSAIAIDDVVHTLEPADFAKMAHQAIYAAIVATHTAGARPDILAVHRAIEPGVTVDLAYLHELLVDTPSVSNAAHHANIVIDAHIRRDLIHAASDIAELARGAVGSDGTGDIIDRARALVGRIDLPAGKGAPDPDVDSFTASVPTDYDWLVPDFLEHRDRMLVTAGEGAGKSTLLAQIGVMVAAGIHPWTHQPCTPHNVLIIDLENSPRLVTRRLKALRTQAGAGFNPQRLRVHSRSDGLDLTTRVDRRWLIDRCQANAAELLVIGPAYRMSAGVAAKGDIGGENQARTVTQVLDDVRERCGVTLLMETHAPHGDSYGRDLRPFGSSVWLRWPEFGIGLAADRDDGTNRRFKLTHWRGPRDQRTWPKALLRESGRWPWTPDGMPSGSFRSVS